MEIGTLGSSFTAPERVQQPNASLSYNLSHNELIDQRIIQLAERNERNNRLDFLRYSLALESSTKELRSLIDKGQKQVDNSTSATATSSASLGLDTSSGQDLDMAIDQVPELSNINSGYLQVNGVNISVDITTDSVNDVISRINSTVNGVTASYDTSANKFSITSSDSMTLSNGTSLFFNTMQVETGKIEDGSKELQKNYFSGEKMQEALKRFVRNFSKVMNFVDENKINLEEDTEDFLTDIKKAVENAFKNTVNSSFEGSGNARLEFG